MRKCYSLSIRNVVKSSSTIFTTTTLPQEMRHAGGELQLSCQAEQPSRPGKLCVFLIHGPGARRAAVANIHPDQGQFKHACMYAGPSWRPLSNTPVPQQDGVGQTLPCTGNINNNTPCHTPVTPGTQHTTLLAAAQHPFGCRKCYRVHSAPNPIGLLPCQARTRPRCVMCCCLHSKLMPVRQVGSAMQENTTHALNQRSNHSTCMQQRVTAAHASNQ